MINNIFFALERDIEKAIMSWDGKNLSTCIENFSTEDFEEMAAWSENHAYGSVDAELFDEEPLTADSKHLILGKFISDCLMMVTQGQIGSNTFKQKELVSHFYNLWMAVNGECSERS